MKNRNFIIVTCILLLLLCSLLYILYKKNFFRKNLNVQDHKKHEVVLSDMKKIVIEYPKSDDTVGCSFDVKGVVPKEWVYEKSFLVKIKVGESIVYQTMATIQESENEDVDVVPFTATVLCGTGCVGQSEIILVERSGDADAQEFTVPVTFASVCSVGGM